MKLTKREKWLLLVLLVISLAMGLHNFFIKPRINRIEALKEKHLEYSSKVDAIKNGIGSYEIELEKIDNLNKEIISSIKEFFPEIRQENMINIIDDMVNRTQIKGTSISFTQPKISNLDMVKEEEEVNLDTLKELVNQYKSLTGKEDIDVDEISAEPHQDSNVHSIESMSATIEFEGEYNGVVELIKSIENYDKRIIISNLSIYKEGTELKGTMSVVFYSVPNLFSLDEDSDYYKWDYNHTEPKDNPFK